MEQRSSGIVANLQALRLVAASLVLVAHLLEEALDYGLLKREIAFAGGIGVDMFFVISGFVMMHNAGGSFGKPGASRKFFVRRLQRIVPIYWVFTTLTLGVMLFASGSMNKNHVGLWHTVASYLFIPSLRVEDGNIQPILGLGWTLNYEMFFYVLFSCALFLPRRIGLPALLGALVALSVVYQFILPPPGQLPTGLMVPLVFWFKPIILEFAAGIVLAMLYQRGARVPLPLAALAVVLAGAWVSWQTWQGIAPSPRWLAWGGPAFVIACAVALTAQPGYVSRIGRAILLGGDASYALYLSHPFTVNVVGIVVRKLHLGFAAYAILGFIGSIAAAVLVHLYVENPLRDFIRGRKPHPGIPEAPADSEPPIDPLPATR